MKSQSSEESAVDGPFWRGLAQNELRIQRCAICAEWAWPPQWRCGACGSWDMVWPQVAMVGIVYSFARTWHRFSPNAKISTPFVSLLVELPQAGSARLLGLLSGSQETLQFGAPVEGFVDVDNEEGGLPTLRWRLAVPSAGEQNR